MRSSFSLVLLMSIVGTAQGCIGIGAWTLGSRTDSGNQPTIADTRGTLDLHKPATEESIKTGQQLRERWGEPDRIILHGTGQEEWIYHTGGWRWAGMILYLVIVPLPAMMPVGSQHVSFLLTDGEIKQATRTDWEFKAGAYCGYFGMIYGHLSCGTGTFEEARGSGPGS